MRTTLYHCDECGKELHDLTGKALEWFVVRDVFGTMFDVCSDHLPNIRSKYSTKVDA